MPYIPLLKSMVSQLGDIMERCMKYSQCFIVGDVNVHLVDKASTHTVRMQQLLTDFDLYCQPDSQPTRSINSVL